MFKIRDANTQTELGTRDTYQEAQTFLLWATSARRAPAELLDENNVVVLVSEFKPR